MPSVEQIRSHFPALAAGNDVLLDNAGGSQVPKCVADAMHQYLLNTYVQLGADYATSRHCTDVVERAHEFITLFMNGAGVGRVILGSSTTALCNMLADCYARACQPGRDEIIVAETAHEANAGPWFRLSRQGFKVLTWKCCGEECRLDLEGLEALLSDRTRIVALPHVSNVLGRVEDVRRIADLSHEHGARVVVDGVAYAPHRAIDVAALQPDWYVYSTYKVFGPHMAAMWGSHEAIAELEGPNHFFIPRDEVPYKFEPGGVSHEGCAGLLGLWSYLAAVSGAALSAEPGRAVVERAFEIFAGQEMILADRLLDWMQSRSDLRVIGPKESRPGRVCTISCAHEHRKSAEIVRAANDRGFGIRFGHFYAHRLCDRLAREGRLHDVSDGVIRISPLHYNSTDEVDALIRCLEAILD